MSVPRNERSSRRGLTLVEALVVLAIVVVLVALITPAVVQSRESARKTDCKNNLKQIGIALHDYHDTFAALPPGWIGAAAGKPDIYGANGIGWGMHIIPLMEANPFYGIDFNVSIADPSNDSFRSGKRIVFPASFRCASDPGASSWSIVSRGREIVMPTGNYVGIFGIDGLDRCLNQPNRQCVGNGAFYHNSSIAFRHIRDGLANTCIVGERRTRSSGPAPFHSTWAGVIPDDPLGLQRLLGTAAHTPGNREALDSDFNSEHRGGAHFLMGDASVRFIESDVDLPAFREMLTTGSTKDSVADFSSPN